MGGSPTRLQLVPHHLPISAPILHHHHHYQLHGGVTKRRFPVGALVEVQTDEEDFKFVYFLATVISSPSASGRNNRRKIHVEYHNLLVHEDGTERLREYVDISFVRPAPPPEELDTSFEVSDAVDAFYKDGWWIGAVTKVIEGGERFVVTFQDPPDELEFGVAELRVHWDWVNGSWVQPVKKSVAATMFDVGKKVEVSFDGERYIDTWFPATIHGILENGAFLVEYSCKNSDNGVQDLKIIVDSLHVRPCPPLLKARNFVLLEKVDAYFDFCWWGGVITKELEDGRYVVFFKQTKRDKEFNQSELRPHITWKDRNWFTSSQLPLKLHTPENAEGNTVASTVNSSGDRKDASDGNSRSSVDQMKDPVKQLTPVNQKPSYVSKTRTKRRQKLSDSLSQPNKKYKEGNIVRSNQNDTHETLSHVPVTQSGTTNQSSENPSSWSGIERKQRKVVSTSNDGEKVDNRCSPMKKCNALILRGKEANAVGKNPEVEVQKEHKRIEKEPVIVGLPCIETKGSQAAITRIQSDRARSNGKEIVAVVSVEKEQLNGSPILMLKDVELSETEEISGKKKRGRPPKRVIGYPETPTKENAEKGGVATDDLSTKDGDRHKILELEWIGTDASLPNQEKIESNGCNKDSKLSETEEFSGKRKRGRPPRQNLESPMKDHLSRKDGDPQKTPETGPTSLKDSLTSQQKIRSSKKVGKEPIRLQPKRTFERGRRRITDEKLTPRVEDFLEASGRKTPEINSAVEIDSEVINLSSSSNELDDEPLLNWIESMNTSSTFDGSSKGKSSLTNMEQSIENSKKQCINVLEVEKNIEKDSETGNGTLVLKDKTSVDQVDQQNLPFVKNTFFWKTIESMEVFKRIPQNPHFQPLEHYKQSSREGLAISQMVNFLSVVEKVSRLQFNDDKSITDDILETLEELETHGFNVTIVRDRLTKLLEMKDKQGKLIDEVNELNQQLLLEAGENSKFEKEISETNEQIRKLQEKLSLAEWEKRKRDNKIAGLKARVLKSEKSVENVEYEFEGIATSTLQVTTKKNAFDFAFLML